MSSLTLITSRFPRLVWALAVQALPLPIGTLLCEPTNSTKVQSPHLGNGEDVSRDIEDKTQQEATQHSESLQGTVLGLHPSHQSSFLFLRVSGPSAVGQAPTGVAHPSSLPPPAVFPGLSPSTCRCSMSWRRPSTHRGQRWYLCKGQKWGSRGETLPTSFSPMFLLFCFYFIEKSE